MTKLTSRSVALLASALIVGAARAQSDTPWAGVYAGPNAGAGRNSTCNNWTPNGATIGPAIASALDNRNCPSGGAFVGGVQFGYNVQYRKLILGLGADYDAWSATNHNRSLKYSGEVFPPGTYNFSGNLSPKSFGVIGPRIGYAGLQWLPYVRVGAIITTGSPYSTLSYTPTGATKPAVSFTGGKNFTTTGWVAGGGAEYGFNGPWSLTVEYLRANLGKGSDFTATCNGSASACAAFSGISFDSIHNGVTASVFRIGINYWFGYWEP
jgi:opacity protein-like surface antigen